MAVNNKEWFMDGKVSKRNLYIMSILKNYCPSYAKHMFEDNRVIEAFYRYSVGNVNPMSMPICKTCHKPGMRVEDPAFNKGPAVLDPVTGEPTERINCYCENHGITYDTKELRRYLIEDLELNPEVIFKIEMALLEPV